MTITAYKNFSDTNVYPKILEQIAEITGSIRGNEIDILNPIIETTSIISADCNYIYIAEFDRYYYCTVSIIRTGLYRITAHVDVLQSWFDDFKNCPCIVKNSTNKFNTYLPDENRRFYQNTTHQYITLDDIGAPSSQIMVTVG